MGESLTQRYRVGEEGLRIVKPCQSGKMAYERIGRMIDGTLRGSTGKLRASSRGNTKGASVVRIYWA